MTDLNASQSQIRDDDIQRVDTSFKNTGQP
jgi:hypothetical protein